MKGMQLTYPIVFVLTVMIVIVMLSIMNYLPFSGTERTIVYFTIIILISVVFAIAMKSY